LSREDQAQTRLVALGRVVGVHGLKGMVRVGISGRSADLDPETFVAQAEALVGREVQGEAQRFPELPPGEYYWFQVLGLPVVHAGDGTLLGHLEEIWPTGAHDIYVVRQGKREVLLPAVEEVIREIDLKEGCLKVWPPEGLLDLYAD
jgi:ribosomal 30S subunit maturation factor RimM